MRTALATIPDGGERFHLEWTGAQRVDLNQVALSGAAVVRERDEIAFYTVGEARFQSPSAGRFTLRIRGTAAAGAFPHLDVRSPA